MLYDVICPPGGAGDAIDSSSRIRRASWYSPNRPSSKNRAASASSLASCAAYCDCTVLYRDCAGTVLRRGGCKSGSAEGPGEGAWGVCDAPCGWTELDRDWAEPDCDWAELDCDWAEPDCDWAELDCDWAELDCDWAELDCDRAEPDCDRAKLGFPEKGTARSRRRLAVRIFSFPLNRTLQLPRSALCGRGTRSGRHDRSSSVGTHATSMYALP
eukprot:1175829-Prorocentrum_minimum.AAC.4